MSLRLKVALTLTLVLGGVLSLFLAVLVPLERTQHRAVVERYQRLLTTLRERYEREIIYDILGDNDDSLAVTLASLAREPEVLWIRVEHETSTMLLTAEPGVAASLVGEGFQLGDAALALRSDGTVARISPGGVLSPLGAGALAGWPQVAGGDGSAAFLETRVQGRPLLLHRAPLRAAEVTYGRFEIAGSLQAVERAELLTRRLLYGLLATLFLVLLGALNAVIRRIVLRPVRRVVSALSAAREGRLDVRLPEGSKDEIGRIAEAFNAMAGELDSSRQAIEAHSRGLEGAVLARTHELSAVKDHLETVISSVGTGVISVDAAGRVETLNEQAGAILGLAPGSAVGRGLDEVLASAGAREVAVALARRSPDVGVARSEVRLRVGGRQRVLSVGATRLPGPREARVVVMDDLTEILTSQRLEAWKQAVERVIHEIKNPLTPIALSAQALQAAYGADRARFDEMFPQAVANILHAVRQLKDLISEFQRFSRLAKVVPRPREVNGIVTDALSAYIGAEPLPGVRVRAVLAADLPLADIDAEPFKRVLLNVVNNGLEAMEGGQGEVLLTTGFDERTAQVVISVRDQGPGIDDVERVFEPYYTTKPKGTGLGLLISRQIIEEHGGQIRIESEVGAGATVEIRLPRSAA